MNFTKAQTIPEGIRVFPSSEADFRAITQLLLKEGIPIHTYQLPSEKLLNVVLREVPIEFTTEQILEELQEKGFTPESVVRLKKSGEEAPMPLILVKLDKKQKHIYVLTEVFSLNVTVETLKFRPGLGQCFRCQRYGHAQLRCTALLPKIGRLRGGPFRERGPATKDRAGNLRELHGVESGIIEDAPSAPSRSQFLSVKNRPEVPCGGASLLPPTSLEEPSPK